MIRFIIVGGFLGAGKTTTIARLAKGYQEQGLNVAIVTNDQGSDLVDTYRLLAEGYNVGEISGACFCGNVETLVATIDQLGMAVRPQVVLVEPIGSCVDLAATVIRPLAFQFGSKEFSIAPYGVILKPRNALRILQNEPNAGVSPKAIYIFRQQLEEADFLVINRIDELSAGEIERLSQLLDEQYPGRTVIRLSAKTGSGFADIERMLDQSGDFGRRVLKLDYDQYAAGEAALGWLNGTMLVRGKTPFSLDALVLEIVRRAQASLVEVGEIAHLKAIGSHAGIVSAANLVDNDSTAELSIEAGQDVLMAQITINARVGIDPAALERCVRESIDETCAARQLDAQILLMQCFRPGGPVPA